MQLLKAVILIGPPGSGKSSISRELSRKRKISSIETGTLLREEINKNTELGKKIEDTISSGEIVPSDIIKDLISDNIKNSDGEIILLDGFPRIPEQIETLIILLMN
jgi:adenylate kinase